MHHLSPANTSPFPENAIPTGSLRLDIALGGAGIQRGQFVEINGPASSGKTTLCLHVVANAQALGGTCAWIDVDHTLDPAYALRCGVKPQRLYVTEPESAEQALETVESLARSGTVAVIVLDSLDALVPAEELNAPLSVSGKVPGDNLVHLTLRRLSQQLRRAQTTVLFTSQEQYRMSAVYHGLAKNPARLALKLRAGLRLRLTPLHLHQEAGQVIGQRVQVKIVKNQISPFLDTIELDIMYNHGVVQTGDLFDLGMQSGMIFLSEGRYTFQGITLGSEREEAIRSLTHQPSLCRDLEHSIRQTFRSDHIGPL